MSRRKITVSVQIFPIFGGDQHFVFHVFASIMPIVDEHQGGLKRYAVFAFVEDTKPGNPNSHALRFPLSPNASSLEASTKLGHTELFHMKRLKSLEKGGKPDDFRLGILLTIHF